VLPVPLSEGEEGGKGQESPHSPASHSILRASPSTPPKGAASGSGINVEGLLAHNERLARENISLLKENKRLSEQCAGPL
jgi:hypothetical protein